MDIVEYVDMATFRIFFCNMLTIKGCFVTQMSLIKKNIGKYIKDFVSSRYGPEHPYYLDDHDEYNMVRLGSSQNDTYIGTCATGTGLDRMEYTCVKKVFDDDRISLFDGVVKAACILRFNQEINDLAPDVVHFDYRNLTIYMAYLNGVTLRRYLLTFEYTKENVKKFERLMRELNSLFLVLHESGVSHGDMKPDNVIVLDEREGDTRKKIKIVDIDELNFSKRRMVIDESVDFMNMVKKSVNHQILSNMRVSANFDESVENSDKFKRNFGDMSRLYMRLVTKISIS